MELYIWTSSSDNQYTDGVQRMQIAIEFQYETMSLICTDYNFAATPAKSGILQTFTVVSDIGSSKINSGEYSSGFLSRFVRTYGHTEKSM